MELQFFRDVVLINTYVQPVGRTSQFFGIYFVGGIFYTDCVASARICVCSLWFGRIRSISVDMCNIGLIEILFDFLYITLSMRRTDFDIKNLSILVRLYGTT